MKQLAGAIVVLAGAVLMGAGMVANALLDAANRTPQPGTGIAVVGAVVGVIGFVGYFRGRPEPPPRPDV